MKAFGEMLLGIPEKKAPESAQPAPKLTATRAEGAKVKAPPSAAAAEWQIFPSGEDRSE